MTTTDTAAAIATALREAIADITHITIRDDTHKHVNHSGFKKGQGHFALSISSKKLSDMPRIKAHQYIYKSLPDDVSNKIHALSIKIID